MTGFVTDPACDFHIRYERNVVKRHAPDGDMPDSYAAYGGFYRYWLDVDGEMPPNLVAIEQNSMSTTLPKVLTEALDLSEELPPVPILNRSVHAPAPGFYTPASAAVVESKFAWAFENQYDRIQL